MLHKRRIARLFSSILFTEKKEKDLIKSFTMNVAINFRPHAIKRLLSAQKFDEKVIAYNYTLWVFCLFFFKLKLSGAWFIILHEFSMAEKKRRKRKLTEWKETFYIFIVNRTECLFPALLPSLIYFVCICISMMWTPSPFQYTIITHTCRQHAIIIQASFS